MTRLGIDTVAPILRRGVLLDVAGRRGVEALPADFAITPDQLEATARAQGVQIESGDAALIRTGWARYKDQPSRYLGTTGGSTPAGPGPDAAGGRWLSARGFFAAGSDTIAFERIPSSRSWGEKPLPLSPCSRRARDSQTRAKTSPPRPVDSVH